MAAPLVERRLAAILAADVVGYSLLMERDEQGTLERLKAGRKELVEALIAGHRGRIVKLMGDGVLCEFGSADDAVRCAVLIQEGMAQREAHVAKAERIRFRIGINVGSVIVEGGDLYGESVNVAARLEGLAEPGGIVLSEHAVPMLDATLRVSFREGGPHRLKNIERPVRVWYWSPAPAAKGPAAAPRRHARLDRPSVAVLPFDNLNREPDTGYFADGITEDIITELSRFRSLFVIDRNSSFAYRGRPVAAAVIGEELGVGFVLSGSIRRSSTRLRVNALLVDAATAAQVWAQRYDHLLTDLFEVHDELVQAIVGAMTGRIEDAAARAARRKPPESLAAYDLVLQGNELLRRHNREGGGKARELYQRAIALDPEYVLAHVRLAQTYLAEFFWDDAGASLQRAFEIARHALEIDDSESWSHMLLAIAYQHRRAFEHCEHHLRRALELNPNDATIAAKAGLLLTDLGRPDQAIACIERARRLDPYRGDSYAGYLGLALFCAERYAEAVEAFGVTTDPKFYDHLWMAACHAHLGKLDKAKEHARLLFEMEPSFTIGRFRRMEPYKNERDLARWLSAFRKLGLPE